jgi:hypothetical protein
MLGLRLFEKPLLYEAEFPPGHFDVSECKLLSCQDLMTDPYSLTRDCCRERAKALPMQLRRQPM